MKKLITMYYDSYEKFHGDGFYPLLYKERPSYTEIQIEFELINGRLVHNQPYIDGYDGTTYEDILKILRE